MSSHPYKITEYSYKQAKKLGVEIRASTNPKKKIDVYKDGQKIASVGAAGMNDYPTYMQMEMNGDVPRGYAAQRRKLYKLRHAKDLETANGYYADKLLW